MSQEDEDVIKVTLIGVAKGRNGHLDVLANFAPEIDDPDEIDSVIIDYEPVSDDGEVTHEHEGWLTAMVQADSGELFTVSVDGELVRFKAGKFKVTKLGVDSALNDITLVPGASCRPHPRPHRHRTDHRSDPPHGPREGCAPGPMPPDPHL